MRPNEVEGRDYFFVDKAKFEGWIKDDMLLEHALVYGDYKGIPRQQVWRHCCASEERRKTLWMRLGRKEDNPLDAVGLVLRVVQEL